MELKTGQHPGAGLQVYLFIGVRWALGPQLTGMISETRPVKHCPTYLKLSSRGRTVDIVLTTGNHVLSNARDIFAQQGKRAVCYV